jgi:uncharacterized protein YciI
MLFVYRLLPPRPTFADDMDADERAMMNEHVAYFGKLHAQGRLIVYGPVDVFGGGGWGLGVIAGDARDDVERIAADDPAVAGGLCTYELGVMRQAVLHASLSEFA